MKGVHVGANHCDKSAVCRAEEPLEEELCRLREVRLERAGQLEEHQGGRRAASNFVEECAEVGLSVEGVDDEDKRITEKTLRGWRGEDGGPCAPGEGAVGVLELRRDGLGPATSESATDGKMWSWMELTPSRRRFAQALFCSG